MAKGDRDYSKNQSRYSSQDSEDSKSPGIGQQREWLPGLSIQPKNPRQQSGVHPDDYDHTITHRDPGED